MIAIWNCNFFFLISTNLILPIVYLKDCAFVQINEEDSVVSQWTQWTMDEWCEMWWNKGNRQILNDSQMRELKLPLNINKELSHMLFERWSWKIAKNVFVHYLMMNWILTWLFRIIQSGSVCTSSKFPSILITDMCVHVGEYMPWRSFQYIFRRKRDLCFLFSKSYFICWCALFSFIKLTHMLLALFI